MFVYYIESLSIVVEIRKVNSDVLCTKYSQFALLKLLSNAFKSYVELSPLSVS